MANLTKTFRPRVSLSQIPRHLDLRRFVAPMARSNYRRELAPEQSKLEAALKTRLPNSPRQPEKRCQTKPPAVKTGFERSVRADTKPVTGTATVSSRPKTIETQRSPNGVVNTYFHNRGKPNKHSLEAPLRTAKELYEAMKGGMTGIGTDEARIFRALHDKSAPHIKEALNLYQEHYRRDALKDLRSELKDNRRFVKALDVVLQGDAGRSAAAILRLELSLPKPDFELLRTVLQDKPPAVLQAAKELYRQDTRRELGDIIEASFDNLKAGKLLALLKGSKTEYAAGALRQALNHPTIDTKQELLEILQDCTRAELQDIISLFQAKYHAILAQEIEKHLSGPALACVQALLQGDQAGAMAARIQEALNNAHELIHVMLEICRRMDRAEIRAIAEAYEKKFGANLPSALAEQRGVKTELRAAFSALLSNGNLPQVDQIHLALQAGTREKNRLAEILKGKDCPDASQLSKDFRLKYGQELFKEIGRAFAPTEAMELKLALSGRSNSMGQQIKNLEELYYLERRSSKNWLAKTLDKLSPHGAVLDSNMAKLQGLLQTAPGHASDAKGAAFIKLSNFVRDDLRLYCQAKAKLSRVLRRFLGGLSFAVSFLVFHMLSVPLLEALVYSAAIGLSAGVMFGGKREKSAKLSRPRRQTKHP